MILQLSTCAFALLAAAADPAGLGRVPEGTLRVYLVRHAEAYSNLTPAPAGMSPEQLDALTPLGQRQARALASALGNAEIGLVLHSPTKRARETAELLRGGSDAPMREEPLLRRIDNGRTESGKPLELKDRVAIWEAGRDVRPPGGESLVDLGQRVAGLVQALHGRTSGTGIVLVTHAEVIGAYLGHLRDVPGADRHPPGIPLASISAVEIPRAGAPRILFVKYEAKLP